MTAGLILAAGESRRMGSPKALLLYEGETFLDRLIRLFSLHCSPVIAVLGAHRDRVRTGIQRAAEALLVENPDFLQGQLSSMQCGLRAVPAQADGVLFTLVDHPAVRPETLAALAGAHGPARLRIPRYGSRRGHPMWFSKSLIAEFLALPATASAREVVTSHADGIAYIPVDDAGILADVDDPAAYAALLNGSLG